MEKFYTLTLVILLMACGGKSKKEDPLSPSHYLPISAARVEAVRTTDIKVYDDKSLYEYIDGGAEIYLEYGFMEVAVADYKSGELEFTLEIYRFKNPDYAFGLYASQRPDNPELVALGAEGFKTSTSIDFVKGFYYTRLIAFEVDEKTDLILTGVASEVDSSLPGDNSLPAAFSLFPADNAIEASEMVYAGSFMGQDFLTDVFSRKYLVDGDTLTLFLTSDPQGDKFTRWFQAGSLDGSVEPGPANLTFDNGKVFLMETMLRGELVAGLKGSELIGIINYKAKYEPFLGEWLGSLP